MGFSRQEYWSGLPFPSPRDLPNPGIKPRSPTLWADSLPAEPPGKSKNTGVDSLSLLKGIFLTQESNEGLLHRRWKGWGVDSLSLLKRIFLTQESNQGLLHCRWKGWLPSKCRELSLGPQALIHTVSLTPNLLQVEEDSLEVTAENRDAQMS